MEKHENRRTAWKCKRTDRMGWNLRVKWRVQFRALRVGEVEGKQSAYDIDKAHKANDGFTGILSTFSTLSTFCTFSNVEVGLPR